MSVFGKVRSRLINGVNRRVGNLLDNAAFDIMYIKYNNYESDYDWDRHSVIGWNSAMEFAKQELSNGNAVCILLGDKELYSEVPCYCQCSGG